VRWHRTDTNQHHNQGFGHLGSITHSDVWATFVVF
jgi:hypothetical protein